MKTVDKHLYRRGWNEHLNDDWPASFDLVPVVGPAYRLECVNPGMHNYHESHIAECFVEVGEEQT